MKNIVIKIATLGLMIGLCACMTHCADPMGHHSSSFERRSAYFHQGMIEKHTSYNQRMAQIH